MTHKFYGYKEYRSEPFADLVMRMHSTIAYICTLFVSDFPVDNILTSAQLHNPISRLGKEIENFIAFHIMKSFLMSDVTYSK